MLKEIDAAGVIAPPANSSYNELVVEAGRASLAAGGALMPERVFAGRVSTLDLAALVAAAGTVVTSDVGMGQLAMALRKPWHRPHAVGPAQAAAV